MNRGRFREIDRGQAPADVKIKLDIDSGVYVPIQVPLKTEIIVI